MLREVAGDGETARREHAARDHNVPDNRPVAGQRSARPDANLLGADLPIFSDVKRADASWLSGVRRQIGRRPDANCGRHAQHSAHDHASLAAGVTANVQESGRLPCQHVRATDRHVCIVQDMQLASAVVPDVPHDGPRKRDPVCQFGLRGI